MRTLGMILILVAVGPVPASAEDTITTAATNLSCAATGFKPGYNPTVISEGVFTAKIQDGNTGQVSIIVGGNPTSDYEFQAPNYDTALRICKDFESRRDEQGFNKVTLNLRFMQDQAVAWTPAWEPREHLFKPADEFPGRSKFQGETRKIHSFFDQADLLYPNSQLVVKSADDLPLPAPLGGSRSEASAHAQPAPKMHATPRDLAEERNPKVHYRRGAKETPETGTHGGTVRSRSAGNADGEP